MNDNGKTHTTMIAKATQPAAADARVCRVGRYGRYRRRLPTLNGSVDQSLTTPCF